MLERHDAPHILKGTQGELRVSFYVDGVLTDAAAGVTVSVTRLDGTALVTAQAATSVATGIYKYVLTPVQTATLDLLTAVWSGSFEGAAQTVTTYHEVVGGHLFSLDDARRWDNGAMASTTAYSADAVARARDRITEEFEEIVGYPLFPRIGEAIVDGDDKYTLGLPAIFVRSVRSIETRASGAVAWVAYTVDELADVFAYEDGRILRETLGVFTAGRRNVRVRYEYGMDRPPAGAKEAALTVLRSSLVPSNLTDRAWLMSDDTGTYRLSTPDGVHRWYGIPSVDSFLERHKAHALAVA